MHEIRVAVVTSDDSMQIKVYGASTILQHNFAADMRLSHPLLFVSQASVTMQDLSYWAQATRHLPLPDTVLATA